MGIYSKDFLEKLGSFVIQEINNNDSGFLVRSILNGAHYNITRDLKSAATKIELEDVKTIASNAQAGMIPMGDVKDEAELLTMPRIANHSYFRLDTVDVNNNPYIWRYDQGLNQWINTKQIVYNKDAALKEELPETKVSKNLFNKHAVLRGFYQPNGTSNILAAEGWACVVIRDLEKNADYTISAALKERGGLGLYSDEATCTKYLSMSTGTFNTGDNTIVKFNLASPTQSNYKDVQFEKGNIATFYAPYNMVQKIGVEGLVEIGQAAESASSDAKEAKKALDITNEFEKKVSEGANKLNPKTYTHGTYLSVADGKTATIFAMLSMTDYIKVEEAEICSIINQSDTTASGVARYSYFFDEDKKYLPEFTINKRHREFTTPKAAFVRCAIYNGENDVPNSWDLSLSGLFKGSSPIFEKYKGVVVLEMKEDTLSSNEKSNKEFALIGDVKALAEGMQKDSGDLEFSISGSEISFKYPQGSIVGLIEEKRGYEGNSMFNFKSWTFNNKTNNNGDDVAPMHIMGAPYGANHGQPIILGTASSHGKTNKDIGSEWLNANGDKFYIVRIISGSRLAFLSENKGTATDWNFVALVVGTLTSGADSLVITNVQGSQLYPLIDNLSVKVMKDGKDVANTDGSYKGNYVDIVESYDVMNVDDILNNLIASKGNINDPIFKGNAVIKVENIYRFLPNATVLIISNYVPLQEMKFRDFMFAQAARIDIASKYYIPNAKPNISGLDFTKPLLVNWSSSMGHINCTSGNSQDAENPINRIMQFADNTGFALGYLLGYGTGKNLKENTLYTFEVRNNTGKIYPHGYDYHKQGDTLQKGKVYSAVMYRSFIDLPRTSSEDRLSMYHFEYNKAEYVFVDYSKSVMLDKIEVDIKLNGRQVEIVQSLNTTLHSDVYNDGVYVSSNYVEGETSFIVLKIS